MQPSPQLTNLQVSGSSNMSSMPELAQLLGWFGRALPLAAIAAVAFLASRLWACLRQIVVLRSQLEGPKGNLLLGESAYQSDLR
jgi:hypothetical protein